MSSLLGCCNEWREAGIMESRVICLYLCSLKELLCEGVSLLLFLVGRSHNASGWWLGEKQCFWMVSIFFVMTQVGPRVDPSYYPSGSEGTTLFLGLQQFSFSCVSRPGNSNGAVLNSIRPMVRLGLEISSCVLWPSPAQHKSKSEPRTNTARPSPLYVRNRH